MSRRIKDLRYWFRPKVTAFKELSRGAGHPLLITRTLTNERTQSLLYKIGRTPLTNRERHYLMGEGVWPGRESRIVTYAAHAGLTAHGLGLAFDAIPKGPKGNPLWETPKHIWDLLYKLAEKAGLDAMGDEWGEYLSWDKGHFSEPGWRLYKKSKYITWKAPGSSS